MKRSVIGCGVVLGRDRHRHVGAEQLTHPADVDDDVGADVDAPVFGQRDQVRQRRRLGAIRRIEQEQQLAPLGEVRLEHLDLGGEEVGLWPGDDEHDASSGTAFCWASTSLSVSKLSFLSDDAIVL